MSRTYVLTTRSGARTLAFDSLSRAMEAKEQQEKRVGVLFRVIEITTTEREVKL